ncbi:MAG TPA: ATP-binding protein, partial [Chloroflexota bacterium]|nr:ATP-binding protein [Chloroflexota bacterium]
YRVDPARTRSLGGSGLGLAIVRQIAEAHGGRVRLASAPGEGSEFTVELPLAAPEPVEAHDLPLAGRAAS